MSKVMACKENHIANANNEKFRGTKEKNLNKWLVEGGLLGNESTENLSQISIDKIYLQ